MLDKGYEVYGVGSRSSSFNTDHDWGFVGDYVEGMSRILQAPELDDYVLATDGTDCVREFREMVLSVLELDYEQYVELDPRYDRPVEVDSLCGAATKATHKLGWTGKVCFDELVLARREEAVVEHDEREKVAGKLGQ